jgi:hypothetical protein
MQVKLTINASNPARMGILPWFCGLPIRIGGGFRFASISDWTTDNYDNCYKSQGIDRRDYLGI